MAEESLFMLYALLLGICITFVYDLLRVFRRVVFHNLFWISVEDLVFWIFCGAEVFLLMYHVSNGTLRWFAVLGALAGMLLYHKTLSRFLVKYVSLFLGKIFGALGRCLKFLFRPAAAAARAAGRAAGSAAGKVSGGRKRFAAFLKKRLTVLVKVLKMIICKK